MLLWFLLGRGVFSSSRKTSLGSLLASFLTSFSKGSADGLWKEAQGFLIDFVSLLPS